MKRTSIGSTVNLQKFVKMIEGYSFNDKLLAVVISPFSHGNITEVPSVKSAPEEIEKMMGFMFIVDGEA